MNSNTESVVNRACGDCQLCCKLLPVRELNKSGNVKCKHQKFHHGCSIYARRPSSCMLWSCLWLINEDEDTHDIGRPDRVHYCIDPFLDIVEISYGNDSNTSGTRKIPAIQVWVDPKYKDAHLDPALRAFVARKADKGYVTIIRYGPKEGFVLFAPSISSDKQWHEKESGYRSETTPKEVYDVIAEMNRQQASKQTNKQTPQMWGTDMT